MYFHFLLIKATVWLAHNIYGVLFLKVNIIILNISNQTNVNTFGGRDI